MAPSTLSPGGPLALAPATVSLCRYGTNPDDPTDVPFVVGRRLSSAQTRQVLAALTLPGRPGGCSDPHDGVLVLAGANGVFPAEIELGGCCRVVRELDERTPVGRADLAAIANLLPSETPATAGR